MICENLKILKCTVPVRGTELRALGSTMGSTTVALAHSERQFLDRIHSMLVVTMEHGVQRFLRTRSLRSRMHIGAGFSSWRRWPSWSSYSTAVVVWGLV